MASTANPGTFPSGAPWPRPLKSIEELAAEQGVTPVHNLDELAALWPADDDPDAFDAFIAEFRAERRAAARRKLSPGA
jgi:hypothetical protein